MFYKSDILNFIKENKQKLFLEGYISNFTINDNRMEKLTIIKNILIKSGLKFFVKIGGCEAFRDIQDCFILGVDGIIVPLIESNYALKKFIEAVKKVYGKTNSKNIILLSSVESIESLMSFDTIYTEDSLKNIDGIFIDYFSINNSISYFKYNTSNNIINEKIINIIKMVSKLKKIVIINNPIDDKELKNKCLFSIKNYIFKNHDNIEDKNKFVSELENLLANIQF